MATYSCLRFGKAALDVPPTLDRDVEQLVDGVQTIGQPQVAGLFRQHDQIWHW